MSNNRIEQVTNFLQEHLPGCWVVYESGRYQKLIIRLKDQLFIRERKHGRGIPTSFIENYFGIRFNNAPCLLGTIPKNERKRSSVPAQNT